MKCPMCGKDRVENKCGAFVTKKIAPNKFKQMWEYWVH